MNPTSLDEAAILQALAQVIDPELGCNIVELGLIYGISIVGSQVTVQMTLTTPGCPMGESIVHGVQRALLGLEAVTDAEVELVWDPPWSPDRMTAAAGG